MPLHSTHVFDLKRITQQTQQQTTYVEPEVSLQHGAEVFSHVWHAGMKSCHQARVEGQKIQPGRGERVSTPLTCRPLIMMIAPPGGAWSFRINLSIVYIFLAGKERIYVAQPYLCLGTVKRARTSFLLLDLVFMFMQKSMAACRSRDKKAYQFKHIKFFNLPLLICNTVFYIRGQNLAGKKSSGNHLSTKQALFIGQQYGHHVYRCSMFFVTLSMRSLLTQLGSCWMKASTMSFRWEPVLASSSSCSAHTQK